MNISICITVLNEEDSISKLLDSLLAQSKKASEIIIVDGGSEDRTTEIVRRYQKKNSRIKLLVEKCTRARGRNLACDIAKGEIIAMTDADCVADRDWLKNITDPFINNKELDISAGFYRMVGDTDMKKAMSVFLGIMPSDFDVKFLPSTRSIAFRKSAWEKIGGFPKEKENSAEDTYFNFYAIKLRMKYARVKNATVEWSMPDNLRDFFNKIKNYANWDAKSKVWFFPEKGFLSHNIKAILIILRYLLAFILLVYCLIFNLKLLFYVFALLIIYILWAFRKVYLHFSDQKVAIYGPILQIISDFGVIIGFVTGLVEDFLNGLF